MKIFAIIAILADDGFCFSARCSFSAVPLMLITRTPLRDAFRVLRATGWFTFIIISGASAMRLPYMTYHRIKQRGRHVMYKMPPRQYQRICMLFMLFSNIRKRCSDSATPILIFVLRRHKAARRRNKCTCLFTLLNSRGLHVYVVAFRNCYVKYYNTTLIDYHVSYI